MASPKPLAGTPRNSFRRLGFPAWGTLLRPGQHPYAHNFTLTLSPEVRSYKAGQLSPDNRIHEGEQTHT